MNIIDNKLWYILYKKAKTNPLQNLMLSDYSEKEILEMETKIVFIKTKNEKLKIAAMAIKNVKKQETNEYMIDEYGNNIKESTGLFSLDIKELDEKIIDNIFQNGEEFHLVKEPKNWGKLGEPNIVLSVLQREIFEDNNLQNHRIVGSNFGSFLKENYEKMGQIETSSYDFDLNYLVTIDEKKKYVDFIKLFLPKEYGGITSNDIEFDYQTMQILIKNELADKTKIKEFHHKYLRYYETVLDKDSNKYKKFKSLMDKLFQTNRIKIHELKI